jgi:hypothetical protein
MCMPDIAMRLDGIGIALEVAEQEDIKPSLGAQGELRHPSQAVQLLGCLTVWRRQLMNMHSHDQIQEVCLGRGQGKASRRTEE